MTGNLGRNQAQAHETLLLGFMRTNKETNKLSNNWDGFGLDWLPTCNHKLKYPYHFTHNASILKGPGPYPVDLVPQKYLIFGLFVGTQLPEIPFIESSSTSAWLLNPLECSPQKQNGWTLRFCFWGWIMWKMYNKTIIEFGFHMISWIIKTSCLCYLPQPSASADNRDLGFDNSWYHAQPHPIIVYYRRGGIYPLDIVCYPLFEQSANFDVSNNDVTAFWARKRKVSLSAKEINAV